jgi:hypothetical protein
MIIAGMPDNKQVGANKSQGSFLKKFCPLKTEGGRL